LDIAGAYHFPDIDGSNGQVLQTNGSGILSWTNAGGGANEINDLSDGITGGNSVFLGAGAGVNDDGTDNKNIAVGIDALNANTSGYCNTANGYQVLRSNTTGVNNTANGAWALNSNTTGFNNTANGVSALYSNTTGNSNTANGISALHYNTSGGENTANGNHVLYSNTTGNQNTSIGFGANYYNQEGSHNTIIGYKAGYATLPHSKSGNVFLGYAAGYHDTTDNKLYIENSFSSSPLIWGDFTNNRIVINGNSSHNTNSRTFFSNGSAGGTTAWFNDSDIRLKKNIITISSSLDKVLQLRGVNYEWKETENHVEGLQMGFIAQEVEEVIPEIVDNSGDYYSMQYAPITALLVEAVKEQQKMIKELKTRIEELEK